MAGKMYPPGRRELTFDLLGIIKKKKSQDARMQSRGGEVQHEM